MKQKHWRRLTFLSVVIIGVGLLLAGCGGSSGGGDGDGTIAGETADSGSVGVFLTDGPADDYDHFWVWLKTIKIYPANQQDPIIIFRAEAPDGQKIDLLDLRDRELLLGVKKNVPGGGYHKIGMEFGGIKPEGPGICADQGIIANNTIDYDFTFDVKNGVTSTIHIDIDVDKSLNSPDDGENSDCEFWPVIFARVDTIQEKQDCPQIVSGVVHEILLKDDGTTVSGFTLALKEPWFHKYGNDDDQDDWYDDRDGFIDVFVSSETTIYDEDGSIIGTDDLKEKENQKVIVRGVLNDDGDLDARLVVFGGVSVFKGTVIASTTQSFTIDLANASGPFVVDLGAESIILTKCDEEWPADEPVPLYYFARVYGKFVNGSNKFLAIVALIRPQKLTGTLLEIETEKDTNDDVIGYNLVVDTNNGPIDVFLPEEDSDQVFLRGDGAIDIETLQELVVCEGRPVQIIPNPDETDRLTAAKVLVVPEVISGTVEDIDEDSRQIVTEEGDTIFVPEGVTILKLTRGRTDDEEDDSDHQYPVEFDRIKVGYRIKAYGLAGCPDADGKVVFDAYIVIVSPGDDKPPVPPEPDTVIIRRNKVNYRLPAREYNYNLIVEGNKVHIKGHAGDDCEDDAGWTIINGDVIVNGNKAEFRDIKFKGDVVINGNKAEFDHVVFSGVVIDNGNKTEFSEACTDYVSGDNDDDDDDDK